MQSAATPARTAPATDRRARIAEVAARLFDERGYHSTSMEDIADAVGLRKPTLYHYFKSKDEILLEIHNEMIDLILDAHERRLREGAQSSAAELRALMHDVIALMETHPGHLRIFFEHQRELPERYKADIRRKRRAFRGFVEDAIRSGIANGEFRDVDVEKTALAVLGMSNWSYQWLRPGGRHTADEVTDFFWDLIMRGIGRDSAPG